MTTQELQEDLIPVTVAELLAEDLPIPLGSFPLHQDEGRQAFLRAFTDVGETLLFQAVAHVWSSLAEPVEARCTAMGMAAWTGGKGKMALTNLLRACLAEVLRDENPLPTRQDFASLHEWHQAAMACFAADEAKNAAIFQHYSAILDGRSNAPSPQPNGEVIRGPWLS